MRRQRSHGVVRVCDSLGPGAIQGFFERWWARLPLPPSAAERDAGYWWDISMRQVEVSRTLVFDVPATLEVLRAAFGSLETITLDHPVRR